MQKGLRHIKLRESIQRTPEQALAEFEATWCRRNEMSVWEAFQRMSEGEIIINYTSFYYRIGEYLTMPIEAIIANGEFVRIRPHRRPEDPETHNGVNGVTFHLELKPLNPEKPEDCLYNGRVAPTTLRNQHWYFHVGSGLTAGSLVINMRTA